MFWKAASPETETGNEFTEHGSELSSGFAVIHGSSFSHRGSFYCTWSSSLYPRCICKCLLSCCRPLRPREPRPAALDTTAARQHSSATFLESCTSESEPYDFSPRASCWRTLKPNRVSLGALKIRGFFTSMLKHWHSAEKPTCTFHRYGCFCKYFFFFTANLIFPSLRNSSR